jgi:hypothetical protein
MCSFSYKIIKLDDEGGGEGAAPNNKQVNHLETQQNMYTIKNIDWRTRDTEGK